MPPLDTCLPPLDFSYKVVESRRQSAAIHVTPAGVQVRIPLGVDHSWAHDFIASKQHWVKKKLSQQQGRMQRVPSLEWGSALLFLGTWRTLKYRQSGRGVLQLEAQEIIFLFANRPTSAQVLAILQAYFQWQAKELLVSKTFDTAQQIQRQDALHKVNFRRTKSKWGHCTSKGNIQYNWLIMGAPMAVITYLVCHEVCHLQELNHSKKFWALVEGLCPDYQHQRRWLKDHAMELSWC